MDDKRSEEPGTDTGVPKDPPEPPDTARREDEVVQVPGTATEDGEAEEPEPPD
ncbi:hypothetical protein OG607_15975 [Streptomyces sp. NBC_01537]|uniref:hypothetical protein n=1 Tax=Streptomyces sp. NBC_01537 TaxID=2903896 RepID=UPI00386CDB78